MLERLSTLRQFSSGYWNQMGDSVYGTIEVAFREFLSDASCLPDGGKIFRRQLMGELMLIKDSSAYEHWITVSRTNRETIKAVGGRFIMPDKVGTLMSILQDSGDKPDA